MNWMLMPLKRYADFRGRSRRKEFWLWFLAVVIVTWIAMFIDSALGLGGSTGTSSTAMGAPGAGSYSYNAFAHGGILTAVLALGLLIPNLAVSVRRLHDIDRTGWWILLPILPYIVGFVMMGVGVATGNFALLGGAGLVMLVGFVLGIVVLIFYCMPGTPGPNRFGADPLDPNSTEDLSEVFN